MENSKYLGVTINNKLNFSRCFLSLHNSPACEAVDDGEPYSIEGFREIKQNQETWQMQFHPQKCNVIHVTNKRKPITHSYKLHDHILEVMENSKY
jgi:hypothetical protein